MKQKTRQFLAIVGLLLLLLLLAVVIYFSFTGNPDFLGVFSLILTLPLIIAGIGIILRMFR
ncbi:MAG: hypothetical protein UHS41_09165 [Lachnospiraceae bacterium]|nr:hypothetical protein [Lachnospiraceae bacterium]